MLINAKKERKKRRKRGIWVKIMFNGTWSTGSYVAGTWSTVMYSAGTWSTRRYLAGILSTAGTLATRCLHGCYSVYDSELLAGTKSTDSTKGYRGLRIKKLFGTKSMANA